MQPKLEGGSEGLGAAGSLEGSCRERLSSEIAAGDGRPKGKANEQCVGVCTGARQLFSAFCASAVPRWGSKRSVKARECLVGEGRGTYT